MNDNARRATVFPTDGSLVHEARATLKSEGYESDAVDAASPGDLANALFDADHRHFVTRRVEEMIDDGEIAEDARGLSQDQAQDLIRLSNTLWSYRERRKLPEKALRTAHTRQGQDDTISRSEVVAILGEVTAVVASLAEENHHLREELAATRNSQIAAFGKHALIDQLAKTGREIENFEVTMDLETTAEARVSGSRKESAETTGASSGASDLHGAIEGLASHVVGLDIGKKIDTKKLERQVRRLSEQSSRETHTSTRGHLRMKFGKLSAPKNGE